MRIVPPIAKVTCPASTGYFPRHRLYRLLDKARKVPVVWVTGPPGCGKTALVSSYIESRHLPCLWYKVDEGDADLSTFFYYLGLAAKKAAPRRKKRLPLLTPDRMPGLHVFAWRYFEVLSSLLPVPSLLVLDDCHRVSEDSVFFETLREGISRLAPGIGTILVSRSDPHPAFARKRANRLMATLRWDDLRLTLEEAVGIVKLRRKGKLPPGLAKDLYERTDGWAAGLVVLLERADRKNLKPRSVELQVPSEIIDYFGTEIFRRLDGEQRDFLLKSAFLPRMTASMAERLTGAKRAGSILSEMNRLNQFTKKYHQREPLYEYHDLFREFLLQQASGMFSKEEISNVRKAAAALLEQSGYVEDAAGLFREVEDWDALARLILSRANSLLLQGRYQRLLEWINALPKEFLNDDPWLLYWKGGCLTPFSPAESRDCFEEALNKFDARREAQGVFRSWAGLVESIISPMESLKSVDAWVDLLPRLLEKYGDLPPSEIGEEVTASMYRALSYRQYPREAVELWTPRAIEVARTTADKRLKFKLALGILVSFQITKDTREAERLFASLRAMLQQPDATPLMRLSVDFVEAVYLTLIARYAKCLRVTTDGLAFAEDTGVHVLDALLRAYGAVAALNLGDFETADRLLDGMAAFLDTMRPLPLGMFHAIIASEALHRRDLARATFHSRECLRLWEESGFTTHVHSARLLAAHVHFALHEDADAFRIVSDERRIAYEIRNFFNVWLSFLTEAYFHLERNDDAAAVAPLRKGLQVGRETGIFGASLRLKDFFEKLFVMALEKGIEIDYVKELIRRNRLAPDPGNPELEHWPWQVKVYTLGRFGLLVDDRPVKHGRKVQQKPLALLKALVALGGRGVGEGQFAELLWPESDGDLAYKSFSVALTRLRRLLGTEEVLALKEGKLSLSNRQCWVDAWAFERFLGQAERARKEGTVQEATRLFEKALSLYQGPFLPFEEYPWAESLREKLRSGFLRAVAHLGQIYEDSKRWREAVSCYGKGIEADELAEDLYRRLIVCLIRQGRHAEALSVYRRCKKTLSLILGVEPSAETRAIASSLGRIRV